jgi:hypothetical protein
MFRLAYRFANFALFARAVDLFLSGKPFALATRVGMQLLRGAARNEQRQAPRTPMNVQRPTPTPRLIRLPPRRWDDDLR